MLHLEHFLLRKKTIPLTITACAHDLCNTSSIDLIVYNTNRPPLIENSSTFTVHENEKLKLSLNASDPDGDTIYYSFSRPLNPFTGVWQPSSGDRGEHTIVVTASDGRDKETIPITVNVLPENKPPRIIIDDDSINVKEGQTLHFAVQALDLEEDNVTLKMNRSHHDVSFIDGIVEWTVPYSTVKNSTKEMQTLEFVADDGTSKITRSVKINIKNVNQAPQILDFLPEYRSTAYVNEPVIFHATVKDEDNDPLTYEWSFSLHEPTVVGTDTIERTFTTPGKKKVYLTVSDGKISVKKKWIIDVQAERQIVPVISPDSIKIYFVGQ